MNQKLHAYVDELFANTPGTQQVREIKEEMLSNLEEKYRDLIQQGITEQEAYEQVIAGIGDIDELLRDLSASDAEKIQNQKAKRHFLAAVATALFVLGLCVAAFSLFYQQRTLGLTIAAILIIGGVIVMIFGLFSGAPAYIKQDDTTVEAVKEQLSSKDKRAQFRKALSSTLWLLVVVIYMLVSFITHWWHITWLIFLLGAVLQSAISYFFDEPGKRKGSLHSIYWTSVVILYFLISFITGAWGITWIIYLLAVVLQQVLRLLKLWREMP